MVRSTNRAGRGLEQGMSLLEVLFAGVILTVGMLGSLMMILMAISDNSRNKLDTTSTMLSQMVIEQINVMPSNNTGITVVPVTDCAGTAWNIGVTAQAAPGNGAALVNNLASLDHARIDWTQTYAAVPTDFKMRYQTCDNFVYEIRWNVQWFTSATKLVTVSTRRSNASNNLRFFAPPVTLRTITGP
jgi:Tfp pilus assembly protein PilV